jgi:hypothetical protein
LTGLRRKHCCGWPEPRRQGQLLEVISNVQGQGRAAWMTGCRFVARMRHAETDRRGEMFEKGDSVACADEGLTWLISAPTKGRGQLLVSTPSPGLLDHSCRSASIESLTISKSFRPSIVARSTYRMILASRYWTDLIPMSIAHLAYGPWRKALVRRY